MNIKWIVLQSLLTQMMCHWDAGETAGADSDSECSKKIVSCIQCSTESLDPGSNICRDTFDPRVKKEFKRLHDNNPVDRTSISKYNISTVMCEGFCIKWIKVPLSGDSTQIVRTCSTAMDIRFSQNTPVCISESRTGKGTMCFCKENMCNSATVVSSIPVLRFCAVLHLLLTIASAWPINLAV